VNVIARFQAYRSQDPRADLEESYNPRFV
jgi:hypothetical protein